MFAHGVIAGIALPVCSFAMGNGAASQ